jgi:hypothetical protein
MLHIKTMKKSKLLRDAIGDWELGVCAESGDVCTVMSKSNYIDPLLFCVAP